MSMRKPTPPAEWLSPVLPATMPFCRESVLSTAHGEYIVRGRTEEGEQVTTVIPAGGFRFHWLHQIVDHISGTFELRYYNDPTGETPEEKEQARKALDDELRAWGVTIGWEGDRGPVAVKIMKADGTPFEWLDLNGVFGIRMGNKLMKRLAALAWQKYRFAKMGVKFVPCTKCNQGICDGYSDDYYAPEEGVYTIMVHWNTTNEVEVLWDGLSIIRQRFADLMTDQMVDHPMDEEIRRAIMSEINLRMNTRGVLPADLDNVLPPEIADGFMVKGDTIQAKRDSLVAADFVTHITNCKPELYCMVPGIAFFEAEPQEQQSRVRTNTQMICHHTKDLFPGLRLKTYLLKETNRKLEEFKAGERPMTFKKPGFINDAIHTQFQKFQLFERAGLHLGSSLKLQMMQAQMMKEDFDLQKNKGPETAKFPVPNAVRVSLSSVFDLKQAGYLARSFEMADNEAFVYDGIGMIVSDEMYPMLAKVWGGADKDDHVYIKYFVADGDDEYLRIKSGDVIMHITRSPQGSAFGIDANGNPVVGSEYFILKATLKHAREIGEKYGELESYAMANRPLIVTEVFVPEATFVPTPRVRRSTYDYIEFLDSVEAGIGVGHAYAQHANIVMFATYYRIPLTQHAEETVYVDLRQDPNEIDTKTVFSHNQDHGREIFLWLVRNRVKVDMYLYSRVERVIGARGTKRLMELGLIVNEGPDAPFVDRWKFNRETRARVNTTLTHHLTHDELARFKEMAREVPVTMPATRRLDGTPINNDKPLLVYRIDEVTAQIRNELRIGGMKSRDLDYSQWAEVGNRVATLLDSVPEEVVIKAFREAWAWLIRATKPGGVNAPAEACLYDADTSLLHGKLITYYIKMLQQELLDV